MDSHDPSSPARDAVGSITVGTPYLKKCFYQNLSEVFDSGDCVIPAH